MREPRLPDGWNWDETNWLFFEDGQYKAWVCPKAGLFVANWRRADGSWCQPWGEDPRHLFANPYWAMAAAAERAEYRRSSAAAAATPQHDSGVERG